MLYELFQNITFKNQWVLPFLFLLPVIAWIYSRTNKKRKAVFEISSVVQFKIKTLKTRLLNALLPLRLLAIGCVILALARPQIKNIQTSTKGEGIDIILCMDVSGSMLSGDFYPNRLEVSKEMAADFVKGRPIDQIGLVIFSGESFTLYPLSTDHNSLLEQIYNLKSGMLVDGTVIGEGLATAVDRLMTSKSKSKVIILLTDGNEQPPDTRVIDPLTGLEIAKAKGVKVYTIGLGVTGTSSVHEKGVAASQSSSFLDEKLLKKIALQTGGAYFRAVDKESLMNIYQQIDHLEKSDIKIITRTRFEEEFIYFIIAALFFILIETVSKFTIFRSFP